MSADAQPPAYDTSLRKVDEAAQRQQFNNAQRVFTRLEWSAAWGPSLMQLLLQPAAESALMAWASSEAPEDLPQLELLRAAAVLPGLSAEDAGAKAMELCAKHLGVTYDDSVAAQAMLQEQADPQLVGDRRMQQQAVQQRPPAGAGRVSPRGDPVQPRDDPARRQEAVCDGWVEEWRLRST